MKAKSPFSMPVLILLLSCLVLAGCGGGGGGGGVTIRGQILLNGAPAGPDKVSHWVRANGKTYYGDVITADGRFSHSDEGLDSEFCVPGCVVTLVFSSADDAAFDTTYVYEYTVKDGDNNLGQIEIGLKGFSLQSPADEAVIGPDPWPPQFQWTAYTRTDITPQYLLNLNCGFLASIVKKTEYTTITLDGNETVTSIFGTFGLANVSEWCVYVEYQENGHTIRHQSETRAIELVPPEV